MKHKLILLLIVILSLIGALIAQATPPQQNVDDGSPPAIIDFSASVDSITFADLEAGETEVELSWRLHNFDRERYDMIIEHYFLNEWLVMSAADVAEGSERTVLVHHGTFGPITYRLSILDSDDNTIRPGEETVIEEWVLTIPYEEPPEDAEAPTISEFVVTVDSFNRADLGDNTPLPVRWVVENRTATTHIVFEQIFESGGNTVNIELPRELLWIPSEGEGAVDPVDESGIDAINIQMKLVDIRDDSVLDTVDVLVPIIGSAPTGTVSSSATRTPATPVVTPSPTSESTARIINFSGTEVADRESEIFLEWEVENAESISITRLSQGGQVFLESIASDLPAQGVYEYTLPNEYSTNAEFVLIATDDQDREAYAFHRIELNCPFDESLTDTCPFSRTVGVLAAYQPFVGGYMLWRADTQQIYAVYNGGSYEIFPDTFTEGEDLGIEEEPPDGLFAPIRGFGKVWADNPGVRETLGWATAPELGYNSTVELLLVPQRPNTVLMVLPDSTILQLGAFGWELIEP
ncbi:MAG: hypothetical protein L0154_14440 [Chloroflexi bacterium]|nr:hypothetical protein [Chloroflexota bacterium]